MTADAEQELRAIRAIEDPEERVRRAHVLATATQDEITECRRQRDAAATVAWKRGLLTQNALAVLLGVDRRTVWKAVKRIEEASLPDLPDPVAVASERAAAVKGHEGVQDRAVAVRKAALDEVWARPGTRPVDLARLTGLTSARITQMGYIEEERAEALA